jgi:hypothetical protein
MPNSSSAFATCRATFVAWCPGRREPEELDVEHVAQPGERDPVAGVRLPKRRGDRFARAARTSTELVLDDEVRIVDVDEARGEVRCVGWRRSRARAARPAGACDAGGP